MKETPPDIDIARELDIFTKAHFPTNDNNDHHQQQNHTIHPSITTDYSQQHYHFTPSFAFTSSSGASSSPSSTSYLHPSPATSILRPVPTHSIAASNALIPTHTPPKNPETPSIYDTYSLSYQNTTMTDSTHSHSGSPLSGYTTPTPYSATQHTAPSSSSGQQQQKQQTFDEFMSMMNMVDQRLQQLSHQGNRSVPLFTNSTGSSPASMSPTHSATTATTINHTLPNASLYTHPEEHLLSNGITSKPTTNKPIASSSTPIRGGRGRRKKVVPSVDRKGKKRAATTNPVSTATPSVALTTAPIQHVAERSSDSDSEGGSSDLEEVEDEGQTQHIHRDDYARDKRRRNTEASARFRVKKKMREQALRRTADEMTLRSQHLQQRVHELEKEIKWLRELIVEKKQSHSTT